MSRREEILSIVANVVAVPTCIRKAEFLLHDKVDDFEKLARVIEHDPGLTANLLKMVNASAIARGRPILTARDALKWLEAPDILQFVISTGVAPSYVHAIDGYDQMPNMHLQHSVATALAACAIGETLDVEVPDYLFTAGLLSGIGKLVLGVYVQVDMHELTMKAVEEQLPFDRVEEALLGINHAEIGAVLLERWGLPSQIVRTVRYHLRPDDAPEEDMVLDLVHVGNMMARIIGVGLGVDGLNYELSTAAVQRLGLAPEMVDMASADVVLALSDLWDLFLECAEDYCVL